MTRDDALAFALSILHARHATIREGAVWMLSRHAWAADQVLEALTEAERVETNSHVLTAIGVVKAYMREGGDDD